MGRKLVSPDRSKAIVNDAWTQIKALGGAAPQWPYIGIVQIVDTMLARDPNLDGRDLGDALILSWRLDETPTKAKVLANLARIDKGRQGVAGYR